MKKEAPFWRRVNCEPSRASFMLPVAVNVLGGGIVQLSGGGDAR